ncbi:MAG TPA: DUF4126 domain-containing protein [Candidatus Limnocylindrales bacterium]|nr:DUF4126 domain-containing protein [Candidatus Limnocylindrales bacterium]
MPTSTLGLVLGTAFASGLNIYATVATLGLLHRFGAIVLPEPLRPLANPVILGLALLLYVIEFFADKIPALDHLWDAVHTFIRPPAAALLAFAAVANVGEPWRLGAALLAGTVALASHGGKATTRVAVNASPEPFSTWGVSLGEDALAIALTWLAATHPILAIALAIVLTVAAVWVVVLLVRLARRMVGRLRAV